MEKIEEKDKNIVIKWLDDYIEKTATNSYPDILIYTDKLRTQNPNISDLNLAKKIVSRKSFKNGLVGAATGVGGLITLPITVPADLILTWKMQVYLALVIAHIFGHSKETTDLKTDIYLILAGNSASETLKRLGIEGTKAVTKRVIEKNITKEIMMKIWKIIPQKIITKGGQKSMTSFMKMVPLVGVPIGFGFNYFATKSVGKLAIKYYSC